MQDPSDVVLRVRRLEIVDASGRARLVIGQVDAGSFGVVVRGEGGDRRIELADHPGGPTLSFGAGGDVTVELGIRSGPEAVHRGGYLVIDEEETGTTTDGL